mmetsp:Transcript_75785/g.93080  ORF Transcript_75785/g.93080 Transcript_75785/m.93080 type:complete len:334 (+) Transcript_75785:58-1059(+)
MCETKTISDDLDALFSVLTLFSFCCVIVNGYIIREWRKKRRNSNGDPIDPLIDYIGKYALCIILYNINNTAYLLSAAINDGYYTRISDALCAVIGFFVSFCLLSSSTFHMILTATILGPIILNISDTDKFRKKKCCKCELDVFVTVGFSFIVSLIPLFLHHYGHAGYGLRFESQYNVDAFTCFINDDLSYLAVYIPIILYFCVGCIILIFYICKCANQDISLKFILVYLVIFTIFYGFSGLTGIYTMTGCDYPPLWITFIFRIIDALFDIFILAVWILYNNSMRTNNPSIIIGMQRNSNAYTDNKSTHNDVQSSQNNNNNKLGDTEYLSLSDN